METPESFLESGSGGRDQLVGSVWQRYREYLARTRALDFDDLLLETVRLLREHDDVRERYRERYRYVLVDEYQDTNHPQYEIVREIGGEHRNVCVVGDDDQSIYGWRGADIRKILGFHRDFEGAKVVRLQTNYRSTRPILDAANAVIRHNASRHDKALESARGEGADVRFAQLKDETSEAQFVVGEMSKVDEARPGPAGGLRHPLPDAGAVPALRGGAARGRAALRGGRRHVLLRPQGGARRRRLPQAGGEPARRDVAPARHQHPSARGGQGEHRQGPGLRHPPRHPRERGVRAGGRDRGALPAVRRGLPGPARDALARGPRRGGPAARRSPLGLPRLRRLPRRGRPPLPRPDDARGALGRRRGDPELRRELRAALPGAVARRLSRGARAHERGRAGGEARARRRGHAHDPPRREGPRVPPRLPGRDGGGAPAARARGGRGRDRGGAPARLRRHHARDDDADDELGLRAREVRPARAVRALALPVRGAGRGPAPRAGWASRRPSSPRGTTSRPRRRGKKKAGRGRAGAGKPARRKPRSR